MSKDNVVDHLCNKQINLINEDKLSESCKKSLLDISNSSENINCADKINVIDTHGKNNIKTSTMLINTDDNKLIETNIAHDLNQLNRVECKFVIDKINSNETDLNSQEENLLSELVKKMNNHVSSTNTEILEIDTQEFMELNLCKAVQQLHALSPTLNLDSTKKHSVNQIDLDNSTVISTSPLINELKNSDIKYKNSIIVNDSKKSEKFNHPSPKIDFEFPIQDQYVELQNEDQDTEIIAFRTMCEAMLKIGAVDNNLIDDNKIIAKKNNEMNNLNFKQMNHNVSCSNNMEYEPSTSKLNSAANDISNSFKRKKHQINDFRFSSSDDSLSEYSNKDISKRLKRKKHQINDFKFSSSDDSSSDYSNKLSSEYSNKLSSKQYNCKSKKIESTFLQNNLKMNSKCYPDTIVIQSKHLKKMKLSGLTFEDEDNDCMLIENPLPKVQNVMINDLKCKNLSDDSLEQNKLLKENQTIFYYSPAGKVHNDMLNYIKNKNCHSI